MKLFIPEIGTKIKLTADWKFVLYNEYRNRGLRDIILKPYNNAFSGQNIIVTIPEDTILTVDRVYIRKGVSDYSSITFNISKKENPKHIYGGTRFWAKLSDVNNIEFELLSCNEKTMQLIIDIDEKTKKILDSLEQSAFMNMLLDGKTVNNVRPQELPSHFINKLIYTIDKFIEIKGKDGKHKNSNQELKQALIQYIRAHKIASFLDED